jgi:hypothetical protein
MLRKKAIVRGSRFDPLGDVPEARYPAAAISSNYGMSAGDPEQRAPVIVYDYNKVAGDTFRVYYSHELPAAAAPPCSAARPERTASRPEIGGFVCPGDGE